MKDGKGRNPESLRLWKTAITTVHKKLNLHIFFFYILFKVMGNLRNDGARSQWLYTLATVQELDKLFAELGTCNKG